MRIDHLVGAGANKNAVYKEIGREMAINAKPIIMRSVSESFEMGSTNPLVPCARHATACRAFPHRTKALRVVVAGLACTGWSSFGVQKGWMDASNISYFCFIRDRLIQQEDVVIMECTPRFDETVTKMLLHGVYSLHTVVVSPIELGDKIERVRKYMVAYKDSIVNYNGDFNADFKRMAALMKEKIDNNIVSGPSGAKYFSAPREEVEEVRSQLAAAKHLPEHSSGRKWKFSTILPRSVKARLSDVTSLKCEHVAESKLDPQIPIFGTICQNSSYATLSHMIPTLARKTMVWSFEHKRPMIGWEHLKSHGLAMEKPGKLQTYLSGLSEAEKKGLAGNGMTTIQMGSVFVFAIGAAHWKCLNAA
jgi:hypothetical protein